MVCGDWRLTEVLGRGGMGTVYAARGSARSGGRSVAVKVLNVDLKADPKVEELFERGSRVLQSLNHPGLPKVYDFQHDSDGRLVLVRERLDGGTLKGRIGEGQQVLGPERVHRLLADLLGVLDYLHTRVPPVFHRDIKPSNVMFRTAADWKPVLADFDSVAAPGGGAPDLTIVVSVGYTAPEQLAGDVSAASDLYSAGATMLYVATHREPDDLPRKDGRFQVEGLLGSLDAPTRRVLCRLVEPGRKERYASAAEALADLEDRAPVARRGDGAKAAGPARRPSWFGVAGVVGLCLIGGVLLIGGIFATSGPESTGPAVKVAAPAAAPAPAPALPAVPPPAPEPPEPMVALASGLSPSKVEQALAGHTFQGESGKERLSLSFVAGKKGLEGRLSSPELDGPVNLDIEIDGLGAISLRGRYQNGDVEVLDTCFGHLTSDLAGLVGKRERRYTEGGSSYTEEAGWSARLAEQPSR